MLKRYERLWAQVDLDAIAFNVRQIQAHISEKTGIIAVVKADGYGHGAVPVARRLEAEPGVCCFAVATMGEAMELREAGIRKPVLILGFTFSDAYEDMVRYDIRPTVFKMETVRALSEAAVHLDKKVGIHVKIDTGMGRIGLPPTEEAVGFIREAAALPGISLEGVFTHFARADERDQTSVRQQLAQFQDLLRRLAAEGIQCRIRHCSNSAGIIELPEANMDAVRAGIILYGLWPSEEVRRDVISLKPAMSLKSRIVCLKEVPAGTPVSYGGTFVTSRPLTRVATIPVGYADGYPRSLSNRGAVLVRGRRAPVIGRVCMDQLMADVTDIPEAAEYDEVTLLGEDGGVRMTAEELGELSGRFNYELVCGISKRVPRIYLQDTDSPVSDMI